VKLRKPGVRRTILLLLLLCAMASLLSSSLVAEQQGYVIQLVAEKKLKQLPTGPLFWQVETFPTLAQAQSAAGETSLAAEVAGQVWLFTLGPMGISRRSGRKVVEIGPVPTITAPEYLLSINYLSSPPGAATPMHTHRGSGAFYVLNGRLDQKTPRGVKHVWAGQSMRGYGADMPIEFSSSDTSDLNALLMFLVDATKSFSTPAEIE
jgi:hypothetical protein